MVPTSTQLSSFLELPTAGVLNPGRLCSYLFFPAAPTLCGLFPTTVYLRDKKIWKRLFDTEFLASYYFSHAFGDSQKPSPSLCVYVLCIIHSHPILVFCTARLLFPAHTGSSTFGIWFFRILVLATENAKYSLSFTKFIHCYYKLWTFLFGRRRVCLFQKNSIYTGPCPFGFTCTVLFGDLHRFATHTAI